jgi:serine/threonine protein kinase
MPTMGRYEIVKEIGRGAMGVVYLAHDPQLQRQVAVKTYHLPEGITEDLAKEFRERFLREARAAASLSHPGIVTVHDAGEDPASGRPFIAMEFVPGESLSERLKRPLDRAWVLGMGEILADALQAAHRAGIVHRDIKPANILIRKPDGAAKIADFGVARLKESTLTQSGASIGSPGYMSPEQVRGGALDGRSDLFSLAVVLYEALCGKMPFQGEDLVSLAYSIAHDTQIPLGRQLADCPADLDRFFDRALSKDPDKRFPDGEAFKKAFLAAGKGPAGAGRTVLEATPALLNPETIPLASIGRSRSLRALAIAGVILLSVGLGIAALVRFGTRPSSIIDQDEHRGSLPAENVAQISAPSASPERSVKPDGARVSQAAGTETSKVKTLPEPPRPEPRQREGRPQSPPPVASQAVSPQGDVEFDPQSMKMPEKVHLSVPAGTPVHVEIDSAVGSSRSQVGDRFTARLTQPLLAGDRVAIPAGSRIQGQVIEVNPARKGLKDKAGSLKLAFQRIVTPDGSRATMSAVYAVTGRDSKKKTAGAIGGGAAGGALLGKVLGGSTKDALLGSVAGAAIGTGMAAGTRGQDVELSAGSALTLQLDQPMVIDSQP